MRICVIITMPIEAELMMNGSNTDSLHNSINEKHRVELIKT